MIFGCIVSDLHIRKLFCNTFYTQSKKINHYHSLVTFCFKNFDDLKNFLKYYDSLLVMSYEFQNCCQILETFIKYFSYGRCKISRAFQLFLCSDNFEVILELTALIIQFVTNDLVLLMDFEVLVTFINVRNSHKISKKFKYIFHYGHDLFLFN